VPDERIEAHEHDWRLLEEKPITYTGRGYVRNWGNDYPVEYQTGVVRRFYCSRCREIVEDTETFDRQRRLTA
jgi:hypothetical protein